jgi:hypothetical protein
MASDPIISSFARTTLNLSSAGFGGLLYGNQPGDAIWRNFLLGVGAEENRLASGRASVAGLGEVITLPAHGEGALVASGVTSHANFAQHTQAFDNAVWFKTNTVVNPNSAIAPDGTQTADQINDTATSLSHLVAQSQNFYAGLDYTFSVYIKSGAGDWARITCSAGGNSHLANFNVTDGTIGYTNLYGGSAKIENAGNGWFRCTVTTPVIPAGGGGVGSINIYLMAGDTTSAVYAGAGWAKYLWGAQLEYGGLLTPYIPALASVVSVPLPSLFGAGYLGSTHGAWDSTYINDGGAVYSNGERTAVMNTPGYPVSTDSHSSGGSDLVYAEINVGFSSSPEYPTICAIFQYDTYIGIDLWYNGRLSTPSYDTTHAHLAYTTGSVVCFAYKSATNEAWVRVNNGAWNAGGTANPETGVGGLVIGGANPKVISGEGGFGTSLTINTGTMAFAYAIPSGFTEWFKPAPLSITGTGALISAAAVVTAVGKSESKASVVLVAGVSNITGNGIGGSIGATGTGALLVNSSSISGTGQAITIASGTGVLLANYGVATVPVGATVHVNFFLSPSGFVAGTGSVGIETLIGYDPVLDPNFITGYNPAFITQYGYDYAEPTGDGITVPAFIGALRTAAVGGGSIVVKFQSRPDDGLGYALEDFAASIVTADLIRQIWMESFDGYVAAGSHQSMDQMEAVWTYSPAGGHINALGFTVRPSSKFEWAANNTGVISFPLTNTDTPPANPMVAVYIDAFGPIASITAYAPLSTADLKAKTAAALDALFSPVNGSGAVSWNATGLLVPSQTVVTGSGNVVNTPVTGTGALVVTTPAVATGAGISRSVGDSIAIDLVHTAGAKQQTTFGSTSPLGAIGQSFTAIDNKIASITPWVAKAGAPVDSMVLKLYAATGDLPNLGALLGTATSVLGSTLVAGTAAPFEFVFPVPVPVTNGTKYVFVLERTGVADSGGFYVVGYFNSNNYASGSFVQRTSGTWTSYPLDAAFTISHSSTKGLLSGTTTLTGTGIAATVATGALVSTISSLGAAGDVTDIPSGPGILVAANATLTASGMALTPATGTGALVNTTPAVLSGIGAADWNVTGSGLLNSVRSAVAGQGVSEARGSGTLVSVSSTSFGIGASRWIVTGTLAANTATVAGVGALHGAGSGALVVTSRAVVSGLGSVFIGVSGIGTLTSVATLAATGITRSSGIATLSCSAASVAAVVTSQSSGVAVLVGGPSIVNGTGRQDYLGSGALVSSSSGLSGNGLARWVVTGTLTANAAALGGSGVTRWLATAVLNAVSSTATGLGTSVSRGNGVLLSSIATVYGFEGVSLISGVGTLQSGTSKVVGLGRAEWLAAGNLISVPSTAVGSGTSVWNAGGVLNSGLGSLTATGLSVSASTSGLLAASRSGVNGYEGISVITGLGELQAQSRLVTGSGFGRTTGAGTLVVDVSKAASDGLVQSTGTGVLLDVRSVLNGIGLSVAEGTGDLVSVSTVNGTGYAQWMGTGFLTADLAALVATAVSGSPGVAVLGVDRSNVTGAGEGYVEGVAAIAASRATLNGFARLTSSGTGVLDTRDSVVTGIGLQFASGWGQLYARRFEITGVGEVWTTGFGKLVSRYPALMRGFGAVESISHGILQAQSAKIVGGLVDNVGNGVLQAGRSALHGVGHVGVVEVPPYVPGPLPPAYYGTRPWGGGSMVRPWVNTGIQPWRRAG